MTISEQPMPVSDRRARAAVRLLRRLTTTELAQVIALVPELRSLTVESPAHESTQDYWRRVLREERSGYQPALDDEFLAGLTYREYFALSETEQDAFWDRVFSAEVWEIEDFEEVDARPDIAVATGQKCRSSRAQRSRKTRSQTAS
jgi:hypothetical protein